MVHWKGGVTSWGGYTKLGEIRPSNSLQDYEVPAWWWSTLQRRVMEEGERGRGGGNAAITPTHLACPRRGHNSVHLPRTPKINAQKQAAKKLGISSLF